MVTALLVQMEVPELLILVMVEGVRQVGLLQIIQVAVLVAQASLPYVISSHTRTT